MPRTTVDPKTEVFQIRLTVGEAQSLRKSAEALSLTKSEILKRGLRWAEAQVTEKAARPCKETA